MRVIITGGHGFIGGTLARELLTRGRLCGQRVDELVLADLAAASRIAPGVPGPGRASPVRTVRGDLVQSLRELFSEPVDVVFHLAAAVSAQCEHDFDLGMNSNLAATRALLEAARGQHARGGPRVTLLFSSSVAVYGPDPAVPLPAVVSEATLPFPGSSYGAQKLACETLIADYTRRGFVDGRVLRLMTVAVRPGPPNAAASGFVSSVVREPLDGREAVCPVSPHLPVAIASPRATVAGILTLAEASRGVGRGELSGRVPVNMPALTITVAQMLEALAALAGDQVADRVRIHHDPDVERIVASWPARFDNARAVALGIAPDPDVTTVIGQYMHDHPEALGL